jgi:hypothetical protein
VAYRWSTKLLYATGKWLTGGVQNYCMPQVHYLPVAYVRHGYATYLWRTAYTPRVALYQWRGTSGVQLFATATYILYATDEVFPSSVCF